MRLFVAVLLVLSATTAQADCWWDISELQPLMHRLKPGVAPDCQQAPDVNACRAAECVKWDEARTAFRALMSDSGICAEKVAHHFPDFITTMETRRVQCNSLQDPLPNPGTACRTSFNTVAALLLEVHNQWPGPPCDDCVSTCAAFRAYQAGASAMTANCRTKTREYLEAMDPNIVTTIGNLNALCDGKGL